MVCEIGIEIENCLSVKYILPGSEFAYIDLYLNPCGTKWGVVRGWDGGGGVVILEGYVFIIVHCPGLSVCLSVCLLATLQKNSWMDFHEIYRVGGTGYKEQLGTFSRYCIWLLDHRSFFFTLTEESMTLSSIAEKRLNGFSWNLNKRTDLTQGAIWNIFGMLWLTHWILGRFIYCLVLCLFVISWKNGWMDFHEFFMKCQARHKK